MRRTAKRHGRRRGVVMVESALILPVFFLLILMMFEHGRLLMTRQLLQNAAREGVRQALSGTNTKTNADITALVKGYLAKSAVPNPTIQVYMTDSTGANLGAFTNAPFASKIAVQIDANYPLMLPKFFNWASPYKIPNPMPLQVLATMSSEAN